MNTLRAPQGGFFASAGTRAGPEIASRLKDAGAKVKQGSSFVLAAWRDFPGQGLWAGGRGAVAYDLDLTNEADLWERCGSSPPGGRDVGELLWALYEQRGPEFADLLRGAFAFALWDETQRSLLAVTDFYGVRSVVYAPMEGGLAAASRLRHLLLHPDVTPDLDPEAVYHYLFYSAIPSPSSIYRTVRKLEPGHRVWFTDGRTNSRAYYDIRYRPDETVAEAHWCRAIPLQVRQAVSRCAQLSASGSTGCFLSGGTDSSSVVGYYTEAMGRPARTFSIGFDEPGYNELDYAHIAARRFATEQHDYFVTPDDVLALVQGLADVYDEPFGNSSVVPTFYCARLAREAGVEVLLAGDGGDEIFGGNERYVTNLVFERYLGLPSFARNHLLEPFLALLPAVGPMAKAKRYVRRANIPNPERFFSYNLLYERDAAEIFRPEFLRELDPDCFLKLARAHYERAAPAHDTDRLLYLDMKLTITDNDLRKVTQMTEAAGVRVRYPLLDRDLVDFAATIPAALKVQPGKNRYIFKRAMEGFLPAEIIQKTKHGFGLPIAPWFRSHPGLGQLLNDTLFSPGARVREWLRPEFLEQMRSSFRSDETSYYGSNFWVFLMLELWLRRNCRS